MVNQLYFNIKQKVKTNKPTRLNTRIKSCLFCLSLLSLYEEIFMRKSPRASFVKDIRSLRILVSNLALSHD